MPVKINKEYKYKTLICELSQSGGILVHYDDGTDMGSKENYYQYLEQLGSIGWEVVGITNVSLGALDQNFMVVILKADIFSQESPSKT